MCQKRCVIFQTFTHFLRRFWTARGRAGFFKIKTGLWGQFISYTASEQFKLIFRLVHFDFCRLNMSKILFSPLLPITTFGFGNTNLSDALDQHLACKIPFYSALVPLKVVHLEITLHSISVSDVAQMKIICCYSFGQAMSSRPGE